VHSRTIRAPKTSHRHPAVHVSACRSPQTGTLAEVGQVAPEEPTAVKVGIEVVAAVLVRVAAAAPSVLAQTGMEPR
jgi:hypothetical protein